MTEPAAVAEPASVVAARQLAEEARARRTTAECATSAVTRARGPAALRTRRARAAVLAAGLLGTAGCGSGLAQACPAVGYGSVLVVELTADWPAGPAREVEFLCDPACVPPLVMQEASPEVVPFPDATQLPGTTQLPDAVPTSGPRPTAPSGRTTEAPVRPVVAVDTAGEASVVLFDGWPDEVTVRVLEGGAVVAELTAEPEFVRVDGTEECGGNTEARIVVPAP